MKLEIDVEEHEDMPMAVYTIKSPFTGKTIRLTEESTEGEYGVDCEYIKENKKMKGCEILCPICKAPFDYLYDGYGRDCKCCSKKCYKEFNWRYSLGILKKEYYPNPNKKQD